MRSREEINAHWKDLNSSVYYEAISIEVLLDIRDLLQELSEDVKTIRKAKVYPKGGLS